jgi:DNA-binding beta-propeller fold protein YncE
MAVGASALLVAGLLVAGVAVAASGGLSYDGCVSSDGSGGVCGVAGGAPLERAEAIAVSPDSKSLYMVAESTGMIAHFFLGAGGQISYDGCVTNDGFAGACADIPGSGFPMDGARGVAVSPNGHSVYVASATADTINHFFAAPGGQLTYDGCISNDGSGGTCADAPGTPLTSVTAVAVSPDGSSVYVVDPGYVVHFFAAPGGQLTYDGCVSNDGSGGLCVDAPGTPLSGANAVAVSPDGRSVYVTSTTSGTITHFFAAPAGQLSYDGCISGDGSGGTCGVASPAALTDPRSVAISPDGKSVYVAGFQPGAVSHFFAAPHGQLTYDSCISNDGSGGACAKAPGSPFTDASSIAVSPDGNSVYVTSPASNMVSTLAAASGGQLTYSGCISADGSDGLCTDAPGTSLDGVSNVAVSPNGGSVYADSFTGQLVLHFFRSGAGGSASGSGGGTSGGGGGTSGTGASGSGGGASGSGGGASGSSARVLSALTVKPGAFTAGAGGPTVVVKPGSRVGAVVTYHISATASVTFVVTHAVPGRHQRVNGKIRCVAPTPRIIHAQVCVRVLRVGSFKRASTAGANSFRFSGRINGARLPVGTGYSLNATPLGGKPLSVKFRIKGA